ncbi:YifB family Mg chelatase-like AAA ATPase [Paenibacillus algorifonticola]|uniref:YifB family Mg chelatase-like AAA ATPase n=1 Tax=Paenibacillus algorifonticola TaxID=684063 RepID=UPI003D27E54B
MFSLMQSATVYGVEGKEIAVEVDIASGLPQIAVVGLPDPAVRESVERVRAAIKNSGFTFPMERITVNLAPADLRKEGTAFDLAIAAGILAASGQLNATLFHNTMMLGELSLNGSIRPVTGVLAMIEQAKKSGIRRVLLPLANAPEAAWIAGMELFAIAHLMDLRPQDSEGLEAIRYTPSQQNDDKSYSGLLAKNKPVLAPECGDYSDVIGQQLAKRALVIAAAGRHNVLFSGPPGTGKTMMIRRLPTILPPLTEQEAIEVTKIYSAAGKLSTDNQGLIAAAPFRAPHHTISAGGLVGGGSVPKPGEVTLAHHGVLYLDELPEFSRQTLEVLRQPLEDGIVTIARTSAVFHFPARMILAVSFNPCPCGFSGHETTDKRCTCTDAVIARYKSKLSGPLLDRIDIQLEVPQPIDLGSSITDSSRKPLSSEAMGRLVVAARERQKARFAKLKIEGDASLSGSSLHRAMLIRQDAAELLGHALQMLPISMRAHDRIMRLSRTVADVEGSQYIEAEHIAEAIQYRKLNL